MSIDVRTGGRLHPVGVMMKRKAVNVTRRQGSDCRINAHTPPVRIEDEEDAHEVDTGSGCSGGCDLLAGERLPKQRPHGDEHPEHNSEEHLGAQVPHQDEEAGSIVFHSSSNASEFKHDNKEAHVTTSAAAKESEEFLDNDAEMLRLIEERRSMPKEEKQRLKDLSKNFKKCIREKKE